jgi:ribosomal protein L29
MNALLFDTLRLSRILRDKGHFTAEQAEALAEALGEASHGDLATKADFANFATKADLADLATKANLADLATKADLAAVRTEIAGLRTELKTEIAELRTDLKTEIAELRTELKTEFAELKIEIAGIKVELLKWIIGAIGFQTVVILGTVISVIRIAAK